VRSSTIALTTDAPYRRLVGVGGIGSGMFLAVEGERTIGRTESRPARLIDVRDYCKLHTVAHHVATLLGAAPSGRPFHVVPVGIVGPDDAGTRLVAEMTAAGIDVGHVRTHHDRPTLFSVCFQYPDGDGGNITTSDSAASALSDESVEDVAHLLDERTIALAQPEVPLGPRRRLLELAGERGSLRAASFTSLELEEARETGMFGALDLVALNVGEAAAIVRGHFDPSDAGASLRTLRDASGMRDGCTRMVVTAGEVGAYAIEGDRWRHRPAPRVDVVTTAGSGDALLAGVLAALAAGVPFVGEADSPAVDDAIGLGVLLASLNATSPHTIHPGATLGAMRELARQSGIAFAGRLADVLDPREG
jgi:sugar/nucleoside kinase (ribokinase family)